LKKTSQKVLSVIVLLISAYFAQNYSGLTRDSEPVSKREDSSENISKLITNKVSGKIITVNAKVVSILSDDKQGDRHQRLILKVGNNTLLLAHNIDIAQRIPVKKGDLIEVHGEYEWNPKGGIIHWTHRSTNYHEDGWIKHNNKKYQ
jgi:hypothetical protein